MATALLLSAHDPDSLLQEVDRYIELLQQPGALPLEQVCHAQAFKAQHLSCRLAIVAKDKEKMLKGLSGFKAGAPRVGTFVGGPPGSGKTRCAFVFTGHGAQHAGMGKWLYGHYPVFKQIMDRCDILFQNLHGTSLLELVFNGTDVALSPARLAHPATFSFEVALAAQLMRWGVQPSAVIGHSVGEYAAACTAGVFDLEPAFELVYRRASLIDQVSGGGGMLAVIHELPAVQQAIAETGAQADIAAINGERAVVVSGRLEELKKLEPWFRQKEAGFSYLSVSNAAHSPMVEPVMPLMRAEAEKLSYRSPQIDMVSNLTGGFAEQGLITSDYWQQHLRNPVLFYDNVKALVANGTGHFLEVGPKPTLAPVIQDSFSGVSTACFSQPEFERMGMLLCLSSLYTLGFEIDWGSVLVPATTNLRDKDPVQL